MNVDTEGAFFKSKLFDKRENFSFKVINFPCMKYSNIPATPSYGIFLSQLMRISRISTKLEDFQNSTEKLSREFLNKGFKKERL